MDSAVITRQVNHVAQKFSNIRQQTEIICKPLEVEDFVVQPIIDVSPPKWHLAHTTWFFENFILKDFKKDYKLFHKDYGFMFNSYYESEGDKVLRADRGNMTRPTTGDVFKFRAYVDEQMNEFLAGEEIQEKVYDILELGLQHEQQHQELLITDIKYILGNNPLFPVYQEALNLNGDNHSPVAPINFIEIDEGIYEIGYTGESFCFDNENGVHKVYLNPFHIADRLISNKEYLEFMEDGGYQDFKHWLSEGWEWVNTNKAKAPYYWFKIKGEWHQFTMSGLKKVRKNEPVTHINFYEADAFASWKGKRLPTEFEWEIACKKLVPQMPGDANFQDSGLFAPVAKKINNHQFFGDVWEWTNSAYRPYPYYKKASGALGEYNGKFMINQMVLRGGSCATPRDHIRSTYRNFFHPHLRWQFTGIRLAENI